MFEHRKQPLIPRAAYFRRLLRHSAWALGIVGGSLALGVAGYRGFEGLPWVDALVNAAMILGGMGPVNELHSTAGKLFAAFYALYSGIVFLVAIGVMFAPALHRFLHRFHLEFEQGDETDPGGSARAGRCPTSRSRAGAAQWRRTRRKKS